MKKLQIKNGNIISSIGTIPITILNIGAGNISPLDLHKFEKTFLLNVDSEYDYDVCNNIKSIDDVHYKALQNTLENGNNHMFRYRCDISDFLESYYYNFDLVTIYRFLEHVTFENVLYFIYSLSKVTNKDSLIDVIVPDCKILAEMILNDNPGGPSFEYDNILMTTELLNEPCDPHASIWTEDRLIYFFELEKRFKVINMVKNFEFENRNIYIRALIERV